MLQVFFTVYMELVWRTCHLGSQRRVHFFWQLGWGRSSPFLSRLNISPVFDSQTQLQRILDGVSYTVQGPRRSGQTQGGPRWRGRHPPVGTLSDSLTLMTVLAWRFCIYMHFQQVNPGRFITVLRYTLPVQALLCHSLHQHITGQR